MTALNPDISLLYFMLSATQQVFACLQAKLYTGNVALAKVVFTPCQEKGKNRKTNMVNPTTSYE